jgi:hypothetical protein
MDDKLFKCLSDFITRMELEGQNAEKRCGELTDIGKIKHSGSWIANCTAFRYRGMCDMISVMMDSDSIKLIKEEMEKYKKSKETPEEVKQ